MNRSRSSAGCVIHRSSALPAILVLSLGCFYPAALHAGLIQRVDATVSGSVKTNGAGAVTSWVDQSGSGNNASNLLSTVSFPSVSLSASGKAALAFGLGTGLNPASNAWFTLTDTSPYTPTISSTSPTMLFRLR